MKNWLVNILWLFLLPFALWSAEADNLIMLENWFASNPRAADYSELKNDLYAIQKQAKENDLPFELIFNKFLEGVAKNAAADQILNVLIEEEQRLEVIIKMINKIDNQNRIQYQKAYFRWEQEEDQTPATKNSLTDIISHTLVFRTRTEIIKQIAIFVRSGLSWEIMERIFLFTREKRVPFLQPLYLFSETIKIPAFSRLTDEEMYLLNYTILASTLSPSSYAVIPSLFLKGGRYNLDYPVIVKIITEKLAQGGSFIRIEQEFKRRGRP